MSKQLVIKVLVMSVLLQSTVSYSFESSASNALASSSNFQDGFLDTLLPPSYFQNATKIDASTQVEESELTLNLESGAKQVALPELTLEGALSRQITLDKDSLVKSLDKLDCLGDKHKSLLLTKLDGTMSVAILIAKIHQNNSYKYSRVQLITSVLEDRDPIALAVLKDKSSYCFLVYLFENRNTLEAKLKTDMAGFCQPDFDVSALMKDFDQDRVFNYPEVLDKVTKRAQSYKETLDAKCPGIESAHKVMADQVRVAVIRTLLQQSSEALEYFEKNDAHPL